VAVALAKSRPYLAVGWFWYLGTLVPVIGLVQVGEQALADRYTYLPLIGIFIIVAWGVAEATQGWPQRTALLKLGAACALGACLFLTMVQTGYWKDSMTLFTHDLAVAKDNRVAHANIGDVLDKQNKFSEARAEFMKALKLDPNSAHTLTGLADLCVHSGDIADATHYFDAALKQRPLYSDAHYDYGNLLAGEGKYADAAHHYELSLKEKPESADAHNNLGAMYVQLGQREDAVEHFKIALKLMPDYPEAHAQLGGVLADLGDPDGARAHFAEAVRLKPNSAPYRIKFGLLLAQSRDSLDAAINQFLEAVKLEPGNPLAYSSLGAAYAHQHRLNAAEESFARAIRIAPKDENLHGRLAAILAAERKPDEAVKEYRETLRLKPGMPVAERDLAWLLSTGAQATNRNGAEAVKLAEDANAQMKSPDPRMLEALDVAYAEAGRFDDAIKTAEKVRQLALAAHLDGVASLAEQRIALYKAGKPFHETVP
jgi:protein O-mannosyl-transferase